MMLDRATTNAIIAAHGLSGDRARVVRLAARMTGDASGLERMAMLMRECSETTVGLMLAEHEDARRRARQREKGARR